MENEKEFNFFNSNARKNIFSFVCYIKNQIVCSQLTPYAFSFTRGPCGL